MMTLDTSVEDWIKKYPELNAILDDFCSCDEQTIKSFMAQKMVGIKCTNCNTATWIKRTPEQNTQYSKLLREV